MCSPARSTIYVGEHIQHTGIFDNPNSLAAGSVDQGEDHRPPHRGARLLRILSGQVAHLSPLLMWSRMRIDDCSPNIAKIIDPTGFDGLLRRRRHQRWRPRRITTDDDVHHRSGRELAAHQGASLKSAGQLWFQAVNFDRMTSCMSMETCRMENVQGKTSTHRHLPTAPRRDLRRDLEPTCRCRPRRRSLSTRPDAEGAADRPGYR